MQPIYNRVLIKISGEALAGDGSVYDPDMLAFVAGEVRALVQAGVQCAIVVGAGNIWRGRLGGESFRRTTGDAMGMMATSVNALAIQETLRSAGVPATTLSAVGMDGFITAFSVDEADKLLNGGQVLLLAAGSGLPFFSTDTAAIMRALQISADAVLFAKNVSGIFTADPKLDPNAKQYAAVSYMDCIRQNLRATDLTAMSLAMEYSMPIECFDLKPGNMLAAACGRSPGTRIAADVPDGGIFA